MIGIRPFDLLIVQNLPDSVYAVAHFPGSSARPLLQRRNVLAVAGVSDHIEHSVNDLGIHVVQPCKSFVRVSFFKLPV